MILLGSGCASFQPEKTYLLTKSFVSECQPSNIFDPEPRNPAEVTYEVFHKTVLETNGDALRNFWEVIHTQYNESHSKWEARQKQKNDCAQFIKELED